MNTSHSFAVSVAVAVGERRAVILNNFAHWHQKNGEDGHNVIDGYVWSYNSVAGFVRVWPYLTEKEVRTALDGLAKDGYLTTGNFNEWKIDRTKWYALTEKACQLLGIAFIPERSHLTKRANANAQTGKSIRPEGQIHLPQGADPFAQEGEPIPLENQIENPFKNQTTAASAASREGDFSAEENEQLTQTAELKTATAKKLQGAAATKKVVEREAKTAPPKINYRERVALSEDEHQKLMDEYGEEFRERCYEKLDAYKGANGKTYKSDYLAILNWVISEIAKTLKAQPGRCKQTPPVITSSPTYEDLMKPEYRANYTPPAENARYYGQARA